MLASGVFYWPKKVILNSHSFGFTRLPGAICTAAGARRGWAMDGPEYNPAISLYCRRSDSEFLIVSGSPDCREQSVPPQAPEGAGPWMAQRTILPECMKKRRPHSIPLTPQTLAILEELKPISGHREHLFPADRNPRTHINNQTANMAIKRMGDEKKLVAHGLRALGSTTLNEQGFDHDLIEAALAHVDKNEIRAAYNRSDYIQRRIPMMEWWSEHVEKCNTNIAPFTGKMMKNSANH
ncbi:MAG: hypothetical protein CMI02_20270 [Oceanospirillaceae bacterium]|nr:hypothetical protein [Oceanospirillaceae bacterium]MBT14363.1 hypothetical protein [Oceanospirillaceae bacterium]